MKEKLKLCAWAALIVLLIGGCIRVDYAVFKAKYPNAGVWSYIWNAGRR